jgi:hypothetical protein
MLELRSRVCKSEHARLWGVEESEDLVRWIAGEERRMISFSVETNGIETCMGIDGRVHRGS